MMISRSSALAHTAAIFASEMAGETTAPLQIADVPEAPKPRFGS
jgi:hypothetical protein